MRSKAKKAEALQDWVCNEVLPTIRKTGSYGIAPQVDLSNPLSVLEALKDSVEKQIVLYKENEVLKIENKKQSEKIDNYESIEKTRRSKQELATKLRL